VFVEIEYEIDHATFLRNFRDANARSDNGP
jgi:hypothetical protein